MLYGRWKKIDAGYGKAVLGYFGKTPLSPDPEVVKIASEQLEMPVFEGDPLEAAPKNIEPARKALEERNLPVTDKNIFLVLAAMVPGKKMELNEGIRLLTGKSKIDIPLKKKEEKNETTSKISSVKTEASPVLNGPTVSKCVVEENGKLRTFTVTIEPIKQKGETANSASENNPKPTNGKSEPIFSTFNGTVDVVDILVKEGDMVQNGTVVARIEAMKATHDIKSPKGGVVEKINVSIGDEVDSSKPIMTIS